MIDGRGGGRFSSRFIEKEREINTTRSRKSHHEEECSTTQELLNLKNNKSTHPFQGNRSAYSNSNYLLIGPVSIIQGSNLNFLNKQFKSLL